MKTKTLLAAALITLGAGVVPASAVTITAGLNDLVLGFYATGGTGATTNVEVNLGNVSQFYGVTGSVGLSGFKTADVVSAYGSNWFNRTDLFWGVVGTTGSAVGTTINSSSIAAKTLWGGRAELTLGLQSTPWNRGSTFAQQGPANTIATLYSGAIGSLNGATAGTSTTAALIDSTLNGSWSKQEGTNASAFGYFNPKSLFDNSTPGNGGVVTDLYELQPGSGAGTYLGSFSLNASGLSYSGDVGSAATAAIPEPSTYAAIVGALALGFVALRRRNLRAAQVAVCVHARDVGQRSALRIRNTNAARL